MSSHASGASVEGDAVQPDPALGVLVAPVVAEHARPAVELESRRAVPLRRSAGSGLSGFVRGSGARYIQFAGRWRSGSASATSQVSCAISPRDAVRADRADVADADPVARWPGRDDLVGARRAVAERDDPDGADRVARRAPGGPCGAATAPRRASGSTARR